MDAKAKYAAGYASIDWTNWHGSNDVPTVDMKADYLHGELSPLAAGQGPVSRSDRVVHDGDPTVIVIDKTNGSRRPKRLPEH
jgi:hypothetical protein